MVLAALSSGSSWFPCPTFLKAWCPPWSLLQLPNHFFPCLLKEEKCKHTYHEITPIDILPTATYCVSPHHTLFLENLCCLLHDCCCDFTIQTLNAPAMTWCLRALFSSYRANLVHSLSSVPLIYPSKISITSFPLSDQHLSLQLIFALYSFLEVFNLIDRSSLVAIPPYKIYLIVSLFSFPHWILWPQTMITALLSQLSYTFLSSPVTSPADPSSLIRTVCLPISCSATAVCY